MKPETHFRTASFERGAIDEKARTVALSFSSDAPVLRSFGEEVLDHNPSSVRLERLRDAAPLLLDHDPTRQIGVVDRVTLSEGKGRALVRFSRSTDGQDAFNDVIDGIRRNVSVGYQIHSMREHESIPDRFVADDWEPLEVSIVSIAADPSVGVGRAKEIKIMTPDEVEENNRRRSAGREQRNAGKDAAEILELADKMEKPELGRQVVSMGGSLSDFLHIMRATKPEAVPDRPASQSTRTHEVGLTTSEAERFSFCRLLLAMGEPSNQRAQEQAAFELEVCAAAPGAGERKGYRVPVDVLRSTPYGAPRYAQRDLVVGTASAGGNLVATDLLGSSFVDILRNATMTIQAGATVLTGLQGDIAIPRKTGAATAAWLSAEQNAATEQNQTFDQMTLSPKEVGMFTEFSRKLMIQSSLDVEQMVRADLASGIARTVDAAALYGPGTGGAPLGVAATSGIGSVEIDTDGGAPTWATVVGLESAVSTSNALNGRLGYLLNAATAGTLKTTEKASGTAQFIMDNFDRLNGHAAYVTNQLRADRTKGSGTALSEMIFGNWADLFIGLWSGVDLIVNPFSGDTTRTIRVTAYQDVDVSVRHPESFAICDDIITS
ncbi:MAG: phage major capsid protein [Pseudomonadaceae bacterium]|nr:phage major capsid protein [Pseudomonadaceae bacterium]